MTWYAAHLVLFVKKKMKGQRRFPVWENIVLIRAKSEEEALAKAEARGRAQEGDSDGTFHWDNTPACWIFAGVRQLIRCEDEEKRLGDGTEVTFSEMVFASRNELGRFVEGKEATARFLEQNRPCPEQETASLNKTNAVNETAGKSRRL